MVVHVAERALESGASRVYVATDDANIIAACSEHHVEALMTRVDHATGTDRIAEVAQTLNLADDNVVVNVQGDEPLIAPRLIRDVATLLEEMPDASMATASHRLTSAADFFNPDVVKVVSDANRLARYFSRAPIPYARDAFVLDKSNLPQDFFAQRHIGIYAYRAYFLRRITHLKPAPSEQWEALEQLRALHYGFQIAVLDWQGTVEAGVDTAEDLARVRKKFAKL